MRNIFIPITIRLLKVNSDYPVDIKEFTIKDDPDKVLEYVNQYDCRF